jgi:hypothetical protein
VGAWSGTNSFDFSLIYVCSTENSDWAKSLGGEMFFYSVGSGFNTEAYS